MSIDLSEFHQVFFEEAGELLAEMETLLLGLDAGAPDAEQLNAIFRAAHSIKGGAGTFGFTEITGVTHILESLLDRIRKGEKALRADMVDAFLAAGDVLKTQLAARRGEGEADPAAAAEICERLNALAAAGTPAPKSAAVPKAAPEPVKAPVKQAPSAPPPAAVASYRVAFIADAGNAALVERIFEGIAGLGAHELIAGNRGSGSAEERFELRLATAAPEEDIWELLAFAVDPSHVTIARDAAHAAVVPPAPEESADFGLFDAPRQAPAPAGGSAPEGATDTAYLDTLYHTLVPAPEGAAPDSAIAPARDSGEKPAPSHGRRTSDDPSAPAVRTGRRDTDKVAVSAGGDASSIRVNLEKVDHLVNLVGELVITQAMLAQAVSRVDPVLHETLLKGMDLLERNTRDLQEAVMSIRMMPIGFVFGRFPRVVRDLAAKLGKEVELKTVGEGTELDKGLIEKISDPLTHLVRNSIDHGIESTEQRLAAGKLARGAITLRAFHQGGNIVIEVSDDGAGLSRARILAKARERGLPVSDAMSDQEVWQLIFEAGFSTADVVTDVSGRGVGMDVVRRNIQGLGGNIEIQSALGAGTTISIRLPLTLAILDGLSVAVGEEIFIVPLTYIKESLQPAATDIKTVAGSGRVIHVRGEYLRVVALHEAFRIQPKVTDFSKGIMVVLEADGARTALFVDELLGQHQVVIKTLESNYRRVPCVSGATIMGDGKVALILDAAALVGYGQRKLARAA